MSTAEGNSEPRDAAPASGRRRRLIAWIAAGIAATLVVVIAVAWAVFPRMQTIEAEWGGGTLTVSTTGAQLEAVEADYDPSIAQAMFDLVPTEYLALRPMEITADRAIPDSGVTLSWTLPAALPADASVTFAYFDEEVGVWTPELTTVSEDRRTVIAVVHHLSIWNVFTSAAEDLVDAVGALVTELADEFVEAWERGTAQLFRFTHELLGNAADNPECSVEAPWWVADGFATDNVDIDYGIGTDPNGTAAVLLCLGTDPSDPELLQVKAAANRGYGFPVVFADGVEPVTAGTTGLDPSLASVLDVGASLFFDGAGDLSLSPSSFVLATQEYTATFDEETVRAAGGGRIISFELPSPVQVMVSSTLKLAVEELDTGSDVVTGILTVLSMVQDCDLAALGELDSATATTVWLSSCAAALDGDSIADAMAVVADDVFAANDPAIADRLTNDANLVRKVLSKMKFLMIFSVAQTLIDYLGDIITDSVSDAYPTWFVQVTLAPERPDLASLFGSYTWRAQGGFTTYTIDADGVRLSDCSGCGDTSFTERLDSATWNGQCFDVVNAVSYAWGESGTEDWLLCPAGFGGPGDDSRDRLSSLFRGEPSSWWLRD